MPTPQQIEAGVRTEVQQPTPELLISERFNPLTAARIKDVLDTAMEMSPALRKKYLPLLYVANVRDIPNIPALQQQHPGAIIVVLTVSPTPQEATSAYKAGVTCYAPMNMNIDGLTATLLE